MGPPEQAGDWQQAQETSLAQQEPRVHDSDRGRYTIFRPLGSGAYHAQFAPAGGGKHDHRSLGDYGSPDRAARACREHYQEGGIGKAAALGAQSPATDPQTAGAVIAAAIYKSARRG